VEIERAVERETETVTSMKADRTDRWTEIRQYWKAKVFIAVHYTGLVQFSFDLPYAHAFARSDGLIDRHSEHLVETSH
jgi:hypothetical protein